jgi:hypothetical protein
MAQLSGGERTRDQGVNLKTRRMANDGATFSAKNSKLNF